MRFAPPSSPRGIGRSLLLGTMLAAWVWGAGCRAFEAGLEDRPCDGGCVEGYRCSPLTRRCVVDLQPACPGPLCPETVEAGQQCPAPGAVLPCPGLPPDCSEGCRLCGAEGRWGTCPRPPPEDPCDPEEALERPCYELGQGLADPTVGIGICTAGAQPCEDPDGDGRYAWGACGGAVYPQVELCNGDDDDCDGDLDGEDADLAAAPDGVCPHEGACAEGTPACVGGQWVCAGPEIERPDETLCDGVDNDCDGDVDEGVCRACQDGADNDGDGAIDFPDDPGCDDPTDDDEHTDLPTETCLLETPLAVPAEDFAWGSVHDAGAQYTTTCGLETITNPEVVYRVEVPAGAESLVVATDYPGTNFESIVWVRDVCDGVLDLGCDDNGGHGAQSYLRIDGIAPGTYFAFIDMVTPVTPATYQALIQLWLPEGRVCDPARVDQRCAPNLTCDTTSAPPRCVPAECAYLSTHRGSFTVDGFTAGAPNVHGGDGLGCDTSRAPERIYRLSLDGAANVTISLDDPATDYDTILYVRAGCGGAQLACNDDIDPGVLRASEISDLELGAGDYSIFVSGWGRNAGAYRLDVTVQ